METASIKVLNDHPEFPLNSSHAKSFFIAANSSIHKHRHHHCKDAISACLQLSDIEMISFQSVAYTSLKDLLPSSPTVSPTNSRKDSWREIPIKDPLVQHAAWAYLQPMGNERGDDRSFLEKLKDDCRGVFACFNDVVCVIVRRWRRVKEDAIKGE